MSDEEHDDDITGFGSATVDPLEALLAITTSVEKITRQMEVPILHDGEGKAPTIPWVLKVLPDDELEDLRERATKTVKVGRGRERQVDFKKFHALIVAAATVTPDLADPRLKGKFGSMEPHKMLGKLVLPGTVTKLADAVMDVSGYDDDELVAEGKD